VHAVQSANAAANPPPHVVAHPYRNAISGCCATACHEIAARGIE
jgi:hypothetical protein